MLRVTQHSVQRILKQDQRDDRMTLCFHLISNADDAVLRWMSRVLRILRTLLQQRAQFLKPRYEEILGRLHDSIRRKRPELWRRKYWLLLQDNVCTSFCPCSRGTCKATGHRFSTPSALTWSRTMHFFVSFPAWKHSYVGADIIRPKRSWLS